MTSTEYDHERFAPLEKLSGPTWMRHAYVSRLPRPVLAAAKLGEEEVWLQHPQQVLDCDPGHLYRRYRCT